MNFDEFIGKNLCFKFSDGSVWKIGMFDLCYCIYENITPDIDIKDFAESVVFSMYKDSPEDFPNYVRGVVTWSQMENNLVCIKQANLNYMEEFMNTNQVKVA